jgi:hypothetical protein
MLRQRRLRAVLERAVCIRCPLMLKPNMASAHWLLYGLTYQGKLPRTRRRSCAPVHLSATHRVPSTAASCLTDRDWILSALRPPACGDDPACRLSGPWSTLVYEPLVS